MSGEFITSVPFNGKQEATILPSYGIREALVRCAGKVDADDDARLPWFCAALVGACTTIGGRSKQKLSGHGYDVIAYGEAVYSWLRESGVEEVEILSAGTAVLSSLTGTLISAKEVNDATDFSEGAAR